MPVPGILGLTFRGTDDRPGHPRTSETLVSTYSIRLYFHHTPNPFT
jgi:hypothetical protein